MNGTIGSVYVSYVAEQYSTAGSCTIPRSMLHCFHSNSVFRIRVFDAAVKCDWIITSLGAIQGILLTYKSPANLESDYLWVLF